MQLVKKSPVIFTTRNGINLQVRPIPGNVVIQLEKQLREPRVPTFYNDAKQRDEENPNDPQYIEDLVTFKEKQVDMRNRAYLLYTSVYGDLPEGIEPVESTIWEEEVVFIGVPRDSIHGSGRERYIDWLKFYALESDADFRDLMTAIYVAGGLVSEDDVKSAIESFPNNQNGTANTDISAGQ